MTEDEFLSRIIDYAQLNGWKVAHFRPARVLVKGKETYRTPVSADGKGFPDLVLARDRLIFAEIKSEKGRFSVEQMGWVNALLCAGCEVYGWRPRDWDAIVKKLGRGTDAGVKL